MNVTVRNDGEDSYGTTVTFFYPPGLSYRRVAGSQVLFLWGKEASDSCRSVDTPVLGLKLRPLLLSSFLYAKRSGPDHGWMDVLVLSGTCLG